MFFVPIKRKYIHGKGAEKVVHRNNVRTVSCVSNHPMVEVWKESKQLSFGHLGYENALSFQEQKLDELLSTLFGTEQAKFTSYVV